MNYLFTLPNAMHVFSSMSDRNILLFRTNRVIIAGESVKISAISPMLYEYRNKLALRLERVCEYLLIEEIDYQIRSLAYDWSFNYDRTGDAKKAFAVIQNNLGSLLRRYLRPELRVVNANFARTALDSENPGLSFAL